MQLIMIYTSTGFLNTFRDRNDDVLDWKVKSISGCAGEYIRCNGYLEIRYRKLMGKYYCTDSGMNKFVLYGNNG